MEDSPFVDPTLRIYRRLREAGHDNVGTVLQAYLFRTPEDLESLLPLRAEPAHRQGRVQGAGGDRVPEEGRRRRGVRPARRALPRGGGVHGRRDARRAADRARARARRRARPDGAPDALRRAVAAAARPRAPGPPRAGRDPVRAGLVPVPDAPARRASGEPALLRREAPWTAERTGYGQVRPLLDQRFAEPGVAFVHRPDRPSACAYRLLGWASTYSRPVLGASATYDVGPRLQGPRAETSRKLRPASACESATCENRQVHPPSLRWSCSSRSSPPAAAAGRRPTRSTRAGPAWCRRA